jgi:hypothetical protein
MTEAGGNRVAGTNSSTATVIRANTGDINFALNKNEECKSKE